MFAYLGDNQQNIESAHELCNGVRVKRHLIKDDDSRVYDPRILSLGNLAILFENKASCTHFTFYDLVTGVKKYWQKVTNGNKSAKYVAGDNYLVIINGGPDDGPVDAVIEDKGFLNVYDLTGFMASNAEAPTRIMLNDQAEYTNVLYHERRGDDYLLYVTDSDKLYQISLKENTIIKKFDLAKPDYLYEQYLAMKEDDTFYLSTCEGFVAHYDQSG